MRLEPNKNFPEEGVGVFRREELQYIKEVAGPGAPYGALGGKGDGSIIALWRHPVQAIINRAGDCLL